MATNISTPIVKGRQVPQGYTIDQTLQTYMVRH